MDQRRHRMPRLRKRAYRPLSPCCSFGANGQAPAAKDIYIDIHRLSSLADWIAANRASRTRGRSDAICFERPLALAAGVRIGYKPNKRPSPTGHILPASLTLSENHMLKSRKKRLAAEGARATRLLSEIELSIRQLENEDLLDLADIFRGERRGLLGDLASTEMAKRNISL